MNELKKQLKEIALSEETYKKITEIGDKHNLMLDLQGELSAEIRDVIMGFKPAKKFVDNIKNRLEIDDNKSNEIAIDVNLLIFEPIIDKLQKIQEQNEQVQDQEPQNINTQQYTPQPIPQPSKFTPPPSNLPTDDTVSKIEKAGDFTIESENEESSSSQYNDTNLKREEVLKGIEDQSISDEHIPLVDHLLTTPVQNKQEVEVRKVEEKPQIKMEKKSYTADPYREQV